MRCVVSERGESLHPAETGRTRRAGESEGTLLHHRHLPNLGSGLFLTMFCVLDQDGSAGRRSLGTSMTML